MFIPTHNINSELIDKLDFLWTVEYKRKIEIDFKAKNLVVMSLSEN